MTWKLATFNVNGIRARHNLLLEWLDSRKPDVVCLQEIKCREEDFPAEALREAGYESAVRGQKGFNGVAILCRSEPEEVTKEFRDGEPDDEARLIAAKVDGVWVVDTYVPQGREPGNPAFQYKLDFFDRLRRWFDSRFAPDQPLIWTGDINVAPEAIDVFDPDRMDGQVGFHPAERNALSEVAAWGFTDLFRKLHPEERRFSFWDFRLPMSFKRNLGWRLDHVLGTDPMTGAAVDCVIDSEPRGWNKPSDHTPVVAEFDLDKLG
jgi:exodeoxyribonuclease-3